MPTDQQCETQYHCGIGELLSTAYRRQFTMLEMGEVQDQVPNLQGVVLYAESGAETTSRSVA